MHGIYASLGKDRKSLHELWRNNVWQFLVSIAVWFQQINVQASTNIVLIFRTYFEWGWGAKFIALYHLPIAIYM